MFHPFNSVYLSDFKEQLAILLDYLYNVTHFDTSKIEYILSNDRNVKLLVSGNPNLISGMSGEELSFLVVKPYLTKKDKLLKYTFKEKKTPIYWVGYVLGEYIYQTSKSFSYIFNSVSLDKILSLYKVYHEVDIATFIKDFDSLVSKGIKETNLKLIRMIRGYSQSRLAKEADVSLRCIQLYEQKQNDIHKAEVDKLYKISKVLNCSIENLIED